ncbi:MAG: DUF6125 family protein [Desulfobacteraceae bacterium]|jgi:hypothetical protein|nr:DUF6125 family protein [Desulfobacteraceae bacterium]
MTDTVNTIEDLSHKQTARLVMDVMHRTIIHYALWFTEIRHQMGMDKALEALSVASEKSVGIQLNRLSKLLGFEMQDGIPGPLLNLPKKELLALLDGAAINWLANDGVWFQSVEFTSGMNDAKRCNDSCWAHFSPVEAWAVRRFLGLGDQPGLDGLKKALSFRVYARINGQSFIDEGPNRFTFCMNECRVQVARNSKHLADYPCKSAGLVEYAYFARAIDPRIQTECIACPPDDHPDEWYCAWRFSLK